MGKKILVATGIFLLLIVLAAVATPLLFGDKLKSLAKEEMNSQLKAKSGFDDISISFFRNFPRLSVGLDRLYITGPEDFARDTLVYAERIDIAVNLFSLLGSGPVTVSKITLEQPRIHAIIGKNGAVNWDIMKSTGDPEATDTSSSGFQLDLEKYEIIDGYIRYDDEQGNMHALVSDLNHVGSGNFSSESFRLKTSTNAGSVNFDYGGIPYLSNTLTNLDAELDINTRESKYSFSKAKASLNEMALESDGFFQLVNDSTYNMDISFNAPGNEFKHILSLVPSIYQKDFGKLKTSGTAAFNGFVKGVYSNDRMPAFEVKLDVKDGFFQYPDLPQPVQDIQLQLKASNPDGQLDNTLLEIPSARLKFGNDPFSFRLIFKNPETIRFIDAAAKGKLDLGSLGKFVKLEEGTKIGGQVVADIEAQGNLEVVLQQKPGPFQAKGLIQLSNLYYASREFPQPIQHTSATINVSNPDGIPDHTIVHIPGGHVEFGPDKIDFSLLLSNPASDPVFDATAKGGFDLGRVKQFYSFEPGTSLAGHVDADIRVKGKKSMVDKEQYDAIQSSGTARLQDILFRTPEYPDGLSLKSATMQFTPKQISVSGASGSFMQTNFSASGNIINAIGFALKDEPLSGNMAIQADKMDLNKWMGTPAPTEQETTATATAPFAVPDNIRFGVDASVNEVVYDKVSYRNVKGRLNIADETVTLQDLNMNALDGSIGLSGSYSTRESKTKPAISLAYQLNNLDVEKTFKAFNTVKYLMPIGGFISGKLNSSLTVNGRLGDQMMPELSSLTGNGMVLLIEGFLSKFRPLEELAGKLKIKELDRISLKDVRQYFEFVNGKVLVKPFPVKLGDIQMEIGGMHGFDQSIDYLVNLKLPRSKLGNEANQLVNGLVSDLAKKGVPVQLGETVSLKVNMGGSILKPSVSYNLQQAGNSLASEMESRAKNLAAEQKAKADSALAVAQKRVRDSLDALKKQALQDAKNTLQNQLFGKKDSTSVADSAQKVTPKRAEEAARGIINDLLRKKKKVPDSTQKQQ